MDLFEPEDVFHEGELAVQQRAGVQGKVERFAHRMIRPFMPDQHREFFEMLPFMVLGLLDKTGRPWATLASGAPGFIASPDSTTLKIGAAPLLAEALGIASEADAKIGLLGIELPTRRRNRMNGTIRDSSKDSLIVHVDQSFGNCPKYIQTRKFTGSAKISQTNLMEPVLEPKLSPGAKALIERTDTFFIASRSGQIGGSATNGIDVSHRGGRPGFVRVRDGNVFEFPDFTGNNIFNTLGNIHCDGRVGIIFTDFETGDAVFTTGRASIIWDEGRIAKFRGALRLVEVEIDQAFLAPSILPLTGGLAEASPLLADTGAWNLD